MEISFNEFEQYIEDKILKRALSYFKNNKVNEPIETGVGEYEAVVEGTEDYIVKLVIKNDTIVEHVCTCPYDWGPFCKHVVAVIFYLQQDRLNLKKNKKIEKSAIPAVRKKRKTLADKVNEMLENTSHDDLKQFIRAKAEEDRGFRNQFLASFAQYNASESKSFYADQVKSILSSVSGEYGFIGYSSSGFIYSEINKLLESAQNKFDRGNYKSAIFISAAIMEEMVKAVNYGDDSSGCLSFGIESSFKLLEKIGTVQPDESIRKMLLEYCLKAYNNNIFGDWDWHLGCFHIASLLLKTEAEIESFFSLIDHSEVSEYSLEEMQEIRYNVLLKHKSASEATEYLEANLSNSKLRHIAIEDALKMELYEKAIRIASDGIKYDQKDRPGLIHEWNDWLLKIVTKQKNTEKIIEYARLLYIGNFRPKQDYYQILKENVVPEKWFSFVNKLAEDVKKSSSWDCDGLLAKIYINEEWWDRLLDYVRNNPNFSTIDAYREYLIGDCCDEIIELYAIVIKDYMENNMGRGHYQNICRYIRQMNKLNGRNQVNELLAYLRKKYPKRKALLEELNMI
ncbi:MAG: hypothetical protein COC06_11280 [Bacteroidales bacterium]|nr:MAG: hypothetical protein COC06_11280 [Bacteroidales bacterium]